jgi:transcriptional regulator with XRE-family HTH domain
MRSIQRRAAEVRRALGMEIRTIREDAGIPQIRLAEAAKISRAHLCAIEAGKAEASTEVLAAIADVLGASLSVRLYPGTGPRIRDHIQAAILEALLRELHPRWKRFVEVPVYRPVRGVIDLVLHDPQAPVLVAVEIQSELRRLEQLIRWSNQKRDALPSADIWQFATAAANAPPVSALLVVRSTRATRAVANDHQEQLRALYPVAAADIYTALTTDAPWPGPGLLWATVEGGRARLMTRAPRRPNGPTVGWHAQREGRSG